MEAVNAFNQELFSLMDSKPPISRAKMISITKSAIKAMKLYKHVVQIVEKFIKKCKPEYKVAGLYVVDSIVRQSRHQFGPDKDVFGPRFTKNITGTFENLCLCPIEDRSKIVRVLNLWQKNGVFKIEVIQPLLDMAAGSGSGAASITHTEEPGSPPSPAKEPVTVVTANSTPTAAPPLHNSDAFAAVAQLFQSSQGQQLQQMLQNFQQQAVKPETNTQPLLPTAQMPVQSAPTGLAAAAAAPHLSSPQPPPPVHSTQSVQQKTAFDMKLLDRFDYDDEPEVGEETKKDEASSQPSFMQQPPVFPQHMEHFNTQMMNLSQDITQQVSVPPNGQLQGGVVLPGQGYPVAMPSMGHALPGHHIPGSTGLPGFPGIYPPQNAAQQQQDSSVDMDHSSMRDGRHGRRSHSGSRSPKRRRSRSSSRSRRSRHRRSRSRSRDRRHHSPRSRSQERRERERERERRQKGLPPPKNETLSICSTTLWVGQLDKRTQQQDVASLLEEFGQIESINMIPPRGCAYIVMIHRQDAYRALQKLSRGSSKVNQKAIKIAWALNKGIKPDFKQYWDVELGVTYVPWSKVREDQLEELKEGGMLDMDTLSPDWSSMRKTFDHLEEPTHNGRSEQQQSEEAQVLPMAVAASHPVQVPSLQQPMVAMGSLQPPVFPGPIGMPPPGFAPGIPLPPFIRPGFNPLQMPPGFPASGPMPLGPIPPSKGGVDDPPQDPAGQGAKKNDEVLEGPNLFNHQMGHMGPPGGFPGGPLTNSTGGHPVGLLVGHPGGPPVGHPGGPPVGHLGGPSAGHLGGPPVGHLAGPSGGHLGGPPVGHPGGPPAGHPGGPPVGHPGGPPAGHPGGPPAGHPGGPQVGHSSGPQVGHPGGPQVGPPGPGGHPGNIQSPLGGLLGARPGMMPLQRPQGPPPSHMQRFPPPQGQRPPHPNVPPGPPQLIPRGPHPQMMRHEPPQPKGGFGMPPPHNMRGPFPRGHVPPPQGPAPFTRPGGPRSFEGQEEMEDRPLRGDRPGFRDREQERDRDWDRDRDRERDRGFGGGRRFGDGGRGGGSDKMDGRDRLGGWQEDVGNSRGGGWERDRDRDRDRDRRDWRERRGSLDRDRDRGRSDDGERDRGRAEGGERSRGEGGSRDKTRAPEVKADKPRRSERRERTSRWDKDDRLAELENMDKFRSSNSTEQPGGTPLVTVETRKEPNGEATKKKEESEHLLAGLIPAADNPQSSKSKEPAQNVSTATKEEKDAAAS
ncbi:splicing factor, arginine/serine-rich 15 isoform X1 [Poecilia reticulata]|uniref:SR-related CTD associated factor 4 n=1 Tax=Poecilia reticulata TaxID=8081 RepID=A0A3P9PAJ9_POERE|nr:PREDICTED: splicing factor, arginine/serine-rich 15 isoform X1 [Poecilia reticulata]